MKLINLIKNVLLREVVLRVELIKKLVVFLYTKKIGVNKLYETMLQKHSELIDKYKTFKQSGIIFLENIISENEINNIINALKDKKCHDPYHPHVESFSIDNPSPECHVAEYSREELIQIPEVIKIANDINILAIVQAYLGCKPIISNVNIWWSFPGRDKPEYAQLYHRDYDDIKFVKLFIYLTDVDEKSGPHIYVKNSVRSGKLRRPKRLMDDVVDLNFNKENRIICTGKKGTGFLEDTFGIHKGQVPVDKKRLLMQVQYSIRPLLSERYKKIPLINNNSMVLDSYVNRLLFDFT